MDIEQYFVTVKVYEGTNVVLTKENVPSHSLGEFLSNWVGSDKTKLEVTGSDGTVKNFVLH